MLDARAKFQAGEHPATLADLYDPLSMPPELLRAHQETRRRRGQGVRIQRRQEELQIRCRARRLFVRAVPALRRACCRPRRLQKSGVAPYVRKGNEIMKAKTERSPLDRMAPLRAAGQYPDG